MLKNRGMKLQLAFGLLVIVTLILTIIVGLFSSRLALKETLKENYMESNFMYAKKLSSSTSDLLNQMLVNITSLGKIIGSHNLTQKEMDDWKKANSNQFNSVFVTDHEGVIQIISPKVVEFKQQVKVGTKIESQTVKNALLTKQPSISEPYKATSGQLILLISAPIFNQNGEYEGLIGGTIHLESDNVLKSMLNNHDYENGSYVYVVDSSGKIIFHPNPERINASVIRNGVVAKVVKGEYGSMQITNTEGNEFFAGFAQVESTGWGIVSQTPIAVIEGPLQGLTKKMLLRSLPLLLLIIIFAWLVTNNLSKPINMLARLSEEASNRKNSTIPLKKIITKSSIYEIRELYDSIRNYFDLLNNQIQLDGLTSLANRRTFDLVISDLVKKRELFSIILLDLDYFKKVNDTYGHLVGDDVLKHLATLMKSVAEKGDVCFRYGGEEFGLLLKGKNQKEAFVVAEKLRTLFAEQDNPTGHKITISIGITEFYPEDTHYKPIVERADNALYDSKFAGRNRSTIYNGTTNLLVMK
ncbi:sensor domain-containing diguanylate cyclase [Fredinandcohnia sp. 179-A 10B2 NHS]|uniref:sensor domain-containing diguanylate cyclase n=1 Tax=Fredinandcohnia sp. 179-A 10B2 NHS TaxID=3235176 RepID=UPI0039A00FB8